jgi:hypothetical protein
MANKPVRQFKTQVAPAGARGYRARRPIRKLGPADNPTQEGNVYMGKVDDPGRKEHGESAGGRLKIDPTVDVGSFTLGQLLYQQQQAAVNQPPPLPQPSANIPLAVDPRDIGYVPPQQPQPLPYTATLPPTALPPQRPIAPPVYGQPNVGVDITPEQFTLPPQQRVVQERPPVVDYGPITTPIERPTPVDISNIEPIDPYDLTPGPQVTATEQSFYDPQPVESAYAAPVDVPYAQPQPQPQPTDIPQDEITNLIDTIIPETLEAKTIDFPQEDPYATQELIDQAGFTQTDPSIYSPAETPLIDQAPEIAYTQPQQEDPYVIDYGPTYGEPITQEATQPLYVPPAETIQQLPITQPPELGMPEIPAPAGDTIAGMENLPPGAQFEDYHRKTAQEAPRKGIDYATPDQEFTADHVGAAEIAEILEEGTTSPVSDPAVTADITGEVDTSYPGADIPLPTHDRGVPSAPEEVVVAEDEGGHGLDEDSLRALIEEEQPEPRRKPTLGGQAAPDPTVTQPPVTQPPVGGRKWLHTGDQDFAETRWQLFGAGQGPPVITDTPAASGPVVNRETGEITTQPLTWWANQPAGSSVSPFGATTVGGTGDADDTGSTGKSGGLEGSFTAEQVAEMAGGSITPVLDYLHPGATSDGQTVTFGNIGNYDDWVDGTLTLRPDLKGLNDLGYEKKDAEGNRVGWGNHALDGFNQLTGAINGVFNFMGDPSKEFTAAILEDFGMKPTEGSSLKEMAINFNKFRNEASQMWETSQDAAWGRKWNALTQTQEYGDMQPMGIFALLTNPPAAMAMTANSLLYDIKNAAMGMFNDNPNYKGNMAQDVLNGAFHFLGKAAKSVGSLFGKLGKAVGGKLNFTSKDMKNDPMEVSRQLLYTSKYGPSGKEGDSPSTMEEWQGYRKTGDVRYELVKTLLENGVDVRFHNNAISFDKGVADARIDKIKTVIDNLGLGASNIEIMAGTDGMDDFPELKAWLEARAAQIRKMAK